MKHDGLKSGVCVYINESEIKWDDQKVNVVMMLSINPRDAKIYSDIFEDIISFFDDDEKIKQLLAVETFDDFRNLVCGPTK